MTLREELQNLLQSVQSPELKTLLSDYQLKLENEAKGALDIVESHINTTATTLIGEATADVKAAWAKVKAWHF